jgi:hypothetical protein
MALPDKVPFPSVPPFAWRTLLPGDSCLTWVDGVIAGAYKDGSDSALFYGVAEAGHDGTAQSPSAAQH